MMMKLLNIIINQNINRRYRERKG